MDPSNVSTSFNNISESTTPDLAETPTRSPISENSVSETEPATSLEHLQTEKQREFLEAIVSLRKHGVDNVVSLPQVVVCGDQSAGKSSVLEAITGIPFPRNDNLCTRFATEINLLYAVTNSITISINPDTDRPKSEKERIMKFKRVITNFHQLPAIMNEAMNEMGISTDDEDENEVKSRPFSRDVLSIEYKGPGRPQLTVVDLPGLIGTPTKKTTLADLELVKEITQHYIEQPRTIILPVVTAIVDLANHGILTKSRHVDPDGQRTLGIITKPDLAVPNSGLEASYIDLVLNNDEVHLDLGWHVVKNRKLDETDATLNERNSSETAFFRTSNWNRLPKDTVGIDSLVARLSHVLFEHIKKELPNLRKEIESKLSKTQEELKKLGKSRSSGSDCKEYLAELSLVYHEICKAAVDGHYEGNYFNSIDDDFSLSSQSTVSRTRAVVQSLNSSFADNVRLNGQKYRIDMGSSKADNDEFDSEFFGCDDRAETDASPTVLTKDEAMSWVKRALRRNRGKELVGNFNPLLIGELYWELSEKWERLAADHVEDVADVCERFLKGLLHDKCPKDVETRIWDSKIQDELKNRRERADKELTMLLEDNRTYPINYNHYYTDTITKRRTKRQQNSLLRCMENATTVIGGHYAESHKEVDVVKAAEEYTKQIDPNMDNFGCEEILDCLFAIYKVQQKTFVANVTTQVVERHIVRGLEKIFSPVFVAGLEHKDAQELACEPAGIQTKRAYLEDQVKKLEGGRKAFRKVLM